VWEDESGKVWLTHRQPSLRAQQYQVTGQGQAVKALLWTNAWPPWLARS
jgi:hypothetical protein